MITTLLEKNEEKLKGLDSNEVYYIENYTPYYYFFTEFDDADGYNDTIVHINAKFFGNTNYDEINDDDDFAFFKGTLADFDNLISKNEVYARKYDLRFRLLTKDEVRRLNKRKVSIRNKWTDRAESYRYLSSSFR